MARNIHWQLKGIHQLKLRQPGMLDMKALMSKIVGNDCMVDSNYAV